MLSQELNDLLTRTGPGTPAGRLLRSYWLPIALPAQLARRNPMPVEVLGEKLVLFCDASGRLGLLDDRCAHRGTSLSSGSDVLQTAGRIDRRGIRCCYHGWLYDVTGQCLEQPAEPAGSRFHQKVRLKSYRAEEAHGFIWAYMGEGEAPLIPPIDALLRRDGHRISTIGVWPCNYFQVCENLVDPSHTTILHIETDFDKPFQAIPQVRAEPTALGLKTIAGRPNYQREVEMLFPTGIRLALPIMEPAMMMAFWVVPVDDTRSLSFHSWFLPLPEHLAEPMRREKIARMERFIYELDAADPVFHASKINAQDKFACASQGPIADRTREHLGAADVGVILLRKLFREAIADVENGRAPRGLMRHSEAGMIRFDHVA
jgi:phthalate 4,5-dioxygenase oxygenase subunit